MMTSLLLLDVQGLEGLARGQIKPPVLVDELSQTMHGTTRQIAVMRAYCGVRVSPQHRTTFREAGFEVVETSSQEDTLVRMALDLAELATGETTYEEAIVLSGTADLTSLARFARQQLMMISVVDHDGMPASLEALADGLIDLDDLDFATATTTATPTKTDEKATPAAADPVKSTDQKPADKSDGDAWPDPKKGPVLVAGAAAATVAATAAATKTPASTFRPRATPTVAATAVATPVVDTPKVETPKVETPKVEAPKTDPLKFEAPKVETPTTSPLSATARKPEPKVEPKIEPQVETKLDTKLEDEISASLSEELVADAPTVEPAAKAEKPLDLEADLAANLEAELELSPEPSQAPGDDSDIDALFADLAAPQASPSTSVDPAATVQPAAPQQKSTEDDVDELLSKLMSDDLGAPNGSGGGDTSLNVVPKR